MEIITNLSSNNSASIRAQIDAEYNKHPALGLRQAELIAYDRAKALSEHRYRTRMSDIDSDGLQQKYRELRAIACGRFARWWYDSRHEVKIDSAIARVCLELTRLSDDLEYAKPLIRDAALELATALDRRETILSAHPELNLSPEHFQEKFAQQVYTAKLPPAPIFTPEYHDARPQQNYLCIE